MADKEGGGHMLNAEMGDEIGCVFMCVFEAGGGVRVWERTRLTLIPLMSRRPCPPA